MDTTAEPLNGGSTGSSSVSSENGLNVVLVGVGGPTSSGKTTLAKHVFNLLPANKAVILHQDDFANPEAELPWNETIQARDWDNPIGSINYQKLEFVLQYTRQHGQLPSQHSSRDHLNKQTDLPISSSLSEDLRQRLATSVSKSKIDLIILIDGFLLYYNEAVRRQIDVRLFLRCKRKTLEHRRANRSYATAEGTSWSDPPGYIEHVLWPGYVKGHQGLFKQGDVECGEAIHVEQDQKGDGVPVKNLVVLDSESMKMDDIVKIACEELEKNLNSRK